MLQYKVFSFGWLFATFVSKGPSEWVHEHMSSDLVAFSQVCILSNDFLIYVVLRVWQFWDGWIDNWLEWVLPYLIQFFKLLISLNTVTIQVGDEILTCLCIFLCYESLLLDMGLSILFGFFVVSLACNWRKYSWCWKDLIEMLKLLTSSLFVTISHWSIIDFIDVRESIDNKCA